MVQYQIQYKPIHPKIFSPITNKTLAEYEPTSAVTGSEKDPKYDMIFYCDIPLSAQPGTGGAKKDEMARLDGEIWVVHSVCPTLKGATTIAKKLVSTYGIDKVQICKITPIATDIVFEER